MTESSSKSSPSSCCTPDRSPTTEWRREQEEMTPSGRWPGDPAPSTTRPAPAPEIRPVPADLLTDRPSHADPSDHAAAWSAAVGSSPARRPSPHVICSRPGLAHLTRR